MVEGILLVMVYMGTVLFRSFLTAQSNIALLLYNFEGSNSIEQTNVWIAMYVSVNMQF